MDNGLTTEKIPTLIKRLAIPASIGFFFNTMYNVVDTFYGGLISVEAIAALSISFPVFFIIIALGSGIGTGSTALVANALGAKKKNLAMKYSAQTFSFSVMLAVIMTIAGLLASPTLFSILGASGQYLETSLAYMNIIFIGSIFFVLTFIFNGILTASGDTKTFRNFLILGFFLNIVLNPLFLFGGFGFPALGIAGIAWATVVIQVIGSLYIGWKTVKSGLFCRTCFGMLRPERKFFGEIAKQGFPAGLNMMTVAVGIFVITFFISGFGQGAVAAYGIATRIEQIFLLPSIGINIAALTLVGQNTGAKKFKRVAETMRKSIKYGLGVMTAGTIAIFLLAETLMGFFTQDLAVVTIGAEYLRLAAFITWAYALLFINVSVLQGMKRPMFALWIGLFRQIAAPIAVFYFLATVLGWGLWGIWWGVFIITWLAAFITLGYVRQAVNKVSSGLVSVG